ncbi:hypothetical protein LF41_1553 [Lysobacter dokdonensis DS-58]|uniref:BON domain-containing protein n=1 Tax=Lysobacter dokdonensis DS-58 TaxID=1300345 RepID=A0A0A2WZ14_9GAMM|nr:BON domain-containing protein [Lysobacter dokdonensis]KGQ18199.1 hypothetical protein LF41_1553 [Lysobacter dokdonensis DS-58]
MNHRDRDQQGRHGGREDDTRSNRGQRDTYAPQPRWLQQDRESQHRDDQRRWSGGRDDDNIGGSQYGGNEYGYGGSGRGSYAGSGEEWGENEQGYGRRGAMTNRDFGGRDYGQRDQPRMREERDMQQRGFSGPSRWDEEEFNENHGRFDSFRVGTGMGVGPTGGAGGDYGREREFGHSYGSASGYGSRAGWDLGTHQRDTSVGAPRQSFRGMGPSHYKRADDRIRDDIYERLTDDHHIDARSIMVDVNEGNVTLSGTVTERRMRYAAEDLVERIGGVSNINNQLRVQSDDKQG